MWFRSECSKISDRLWDYSAQRLSASETAQVESHLQRCAPCQAEAEAYLQTIGLLSSARSIPVPASQKTWQDLRPGLTPARRPVLRSADLLPRLTLAGAGTVLAATLLVVFLSGGHHPLQPIAPGSGSSDQHAPVTVGPVTSPSNTKDVAQKDVVQNDSIPETQTSAPGTVIETFFPGLLSVPNPVVKPTAVATPRLSVLRPRDTSHTTRVATNGRGRSHSLANSGDAEAQLDGGNVAPRAQQNYVLNPVSSSEEETTHRYVISSIPSAQNGKGLIASSDEMEEGRAW